MTSTSVCGCEPQSTMSVRFGYGRSLFFLLLVCVTGSYSLTCPSSYASDMRALCHGRCADLNRATPYNYSVCVDRCCGDTGSNESSSFPTDCPLSTLNCSVPDGQTVAPVVAWRNGSIILQNSNSAIPTGTDVCSTLTSGNLTNTSTSILLVQVQDVVNNVSTNWILFAGVENELNEVSAGCYSVSVATVTRCGRSEFSQSYTLPPPVYINEVEVLFSELDALPVISVSWHIIGGEDVCDPVMNTTMYATADNVFNDELPYACPTASKLTHGNSDSVQFFSGDFQNGSVWLCTYDVHISLSYRSNCTEAESSAVSLSKGNLIFMPEENSTWLDTYRFEWNETSLTYTLLIDWTVPCVNGFCNIVERFHIFVVYPRVPFSSHCVRAATFENDNKRYERSFPGYCPLADKSFFYPPGAERNNYLISLEPIFDQTRLPFSTSEITKRNTIVLAAPGEPPSSVGNLTVVWEDSKFLISWEEPVVTNGGITNYIVKSTVLSSAGNMITSLNYTTNETFCFDLSSLDSGFDINLATNVSVQVAASNRFQTSVFSNVTYQYAGAPMMKPLLVDGSIIAVVVICIFIVVLLLVVVVLIVLLKCKGKRKSWPRFSVHWHRGTQQDIDTNSALRQMRANHWSFSELQAKLPPDIQDRWNISFSSFVPESFRLLGSGNFSTVYLCRVKAPITTPTNLAQFQTYADQAVAVKLLRGTASEQEIASFFNEADIMKKLSSQSCNYIVQLVGLQVEQAPVMIAMELVPCGNLLDILKNSRISEESDAEVFVDQTPRSQGSFKKKMLQKTDTQLTLTEFQLERSGSIDSYVQLRHLSFSKAGSPDPPEDTKIILKPSQLLKFALQVSRGMEFLISCRVLHRDLACRNLLLGSNGIVKISDFGLACYFEEENNVVSDLPSENKPLRWMAPEAFAHNTYSEASDVWSFGITVWEMFSKGVFPYASMSDEEVLSFVVGGSTMEKPTDCDPELYSIMLKCWRLDSKERPSFTTLIKLLDQFIYQLYPYMMMEIEECADEDDGE